MVQPLQLSLSVRKTMSAPPLLFDRALHRRRLDRAAPHFAQSDFLKARAVEDMVERVGGIMRSFPIAVDLGARDGAFARAVAGGGLGDKIGMLVETDLSGAMLAGRGGLRVVADEERLPFKDASLDLVVSTLALHWTNDLPGALVQIRRALKPDGVFVGSILGGSTLIELRRSMMQAEAELFGGAGPRISPFADAQDLAGLLQRAGLKLPVADAEKVTVRYTQPLRLFQDLRRMGETNVLMERPRRPLSRALIARTLEIYAEQFSAPEGGFKATFEIVTATGWAPT
jgi:SAM-dependent methyltransferase